MSGVVLRCPHCCTTQASQGECQACHEAAVRYFCSNHTPGRWLDGPRCSDCGAMFGAPATPVPPPRRSPPTRPDVSNTARRTMPPSRVPAGRETWRPEPASRSRKRATFPPLRTDYGHREETPEDVEDPYHFEPRIELPPPAIVFGGFVRLALRIALFFIFLFLLLSLLVGGSLVHVVYF
jgi:hypothetical protein